MKHLTAPPDLGRLPVEYVPVVAKALAKNPEVRYSSMAEMVRAVEAVGENVQPVRAAARDVRPVAESARPRPNSDPMLTALPVETPRYKAAELFGSMLLAVLFCALGAALWVAALGRGRDIGELSNLFFLSVLASWAVLIPAKFWTSRRGNAWSRRVAMLFPGMVLGLLAWWLEGGSIAPSAITSTITMDPFSEASPFPLPSTSLTEVSSYLSYYALAFFALRWWQMTDRRRAARFSFAPLLAAAFWGLVLLVVGHNRQFNFGGTTGVLVLVMAAAVVQLVSPWEQPPPPIAKRVRLRTA